MSRSCSHIYMWIAVEAVDVSNMRILGPYKNSQPLVLGENDTPDSPSALRFSVLSVTYECG